MTLQSKSKITCITRLVLASMFLAAAWVSASAQTNTFPSTGNAGVGTTSPGNKLEVKGGSGPSDGAVDGLVLSTTRTEFTTKGRVASNFDGLYLSQNAYYNNSAWVADNTSRSVALIVLEAGNANSGLYFFTSATNNNGPGTERMRIDKNGNVGIGTTSPIYSLDVSGGVNGFRAKATTTSSNDAIATFENSSGIQAIIRGNGNVGIGTTSPGGRLHVSSGSNAEIRITDTTTGNPYLSFYDGSTAKGYVQYSAGTMDFYAPTGVAARIVTNSTERLRVDVSGNVGIGTASPASGYKLDVNGNTNVTGNLNVTGNINAKYQDLAEWVPSSEQLSAGTVVVLDTTKSNQVISSTMNYDTRVAGVISAQPGITLGESGEGKVLVATTGRVRVKVDASRGAIQIGDLLVTSDVAGVAMRSEAVNLGGVQIHRPGTIIGKALEPLAKGSGEILVLLSLQ